jgi:hypothetical protein
MPPPGSHQASRAGLLGLPDDSTESGSRADPLEGDAGDPDDGRGA